MSELSQSKTKIIAWCFYDWANSSYFAVVTTFIFAAYFTEKVAPDKIIGSYWWGNAVAIAALMVALLSPVLGSIVDYGGNRKKWLFGFTYLGIVASAGLWFAYPSVSYAPITLACVILGIVAIETGMTFYNSMLPDLIPKHYLGRVSGWGWGSGYVGGIVCLVITLFVFVKNSLTWLDPASFENVRICGPFVAVWLALFSLPLFLWVPDTASKKASPRKAIKQGLSSLFTTLKTLLKDKNLLLFYISRAFYIDGLNTLFVFGGIYSAGVFHMGMQEIIVFGIVLNVTAGIGAIAFAWVDDWLGAKTTILISLTGLIVSSTALLLIQSKSTYWLIAPIMGIFVGPVQAASRSLLVRIVPKESITEKFGLFALSGKATAFLGPWLVAAITLWTSNQRWGMSIIVVFYIFGLLLVMFVRERRIIVQALPYA
jgi:UMF1 family MFS transporter